MPPTKFAHWNTFQFMARRPSEQHQSRLFRLPRELRNLIYEYYVFETNGYAYEPLPGKMMHRSSSSETQGLVRLSLPVTCRKAAEELKGVAWGTNTIHFNTLCSVHDGAEFRGVGSKAGRLKCLLFYAQTQRVRMLVRTAELLQIEDFADIDRRFPTVSHYFGIPLQDAIQPPVDYLDGSINSGDWGDIVGDKSFDDALQCLLEKARARNRSKFTSLVAALYGFGRSPVRPAVPDRPCRNIFYAGAFEHFYDWNPATWDIPQESELASMEALLTKPWKVNAEKGQAITENGLVLDELDARCDRKSNAHEFARNTKWYFSAAAVAIEFLKGLSTSKRLDLKQICLHESFKSVNRPECHATGLIPFCVENPQLRIERHVGLLTNMLPVSFKELTHSGFGFSWLLGGEALYAMWDWIYEALQLPGRGMPEKCFKLVVNASDRESVEAWEVMKYTAMLQDAMGIWAKHHDVEPASKVMDPYYIYSRWPLPWHIPSNFSQAVRDIVQQSSIVEFSGANGVLWDAQAFFAARVHWKMDDWRFRNNAPEAVRGISTSFYLGLRARYSIEPESSE